jgi:splicing factor 1
MNNFVPEDPDLRSPSPEPIYDNQGKRINTREVRKRDNFLRERISLIEDCMKMRKAYVFLNSRFVPPSDYKPLKKFKKIYLTDNAVNDKKANYIGKIIGPGGRTQKLIEQRSGCRIAVRGRGANKQAKDIFENYEPLHIIIVADKDEELEKGVEEIEKILNGEED